MAGTFSVGGLVSGIDSNTLIQQLMQIERQPILRIQAHLDRLEQSRTALRDLRTQLTTLRNRTQDFQLQNQFDQFSAASSETTVLSAAVSGSSPVQGSYALNVLQLASATTANSSAKLGAAIDPNVALDSSGIQEEVSSGTFTINGVEFTVDATADSLTAVLNDINASSAGVTATYDGVTDKVTFENSNPNDTSVINFGAEDDTSSLLSVIHVTGATQSTGGNGSTVATSTRNLGAIAPGVTLNTVDFANGAVSAGSFRINGVQITVDPTNDSLSDVLARINGSGANVTASYDTTTDSIRIVSRTLGSRTVNFQAGTSNFLNVTNLTTATQTAGNDSQFTVNGGPAQTRNTNEVADALGGVTLTLLSAGQTTVTVSTDDDAIIEDVRAFIDEFNTSVQQIQGLIGRDALLDNDFTLRLVQDYLRTTIFSPVTGIGSNFNSLQSVGISTSSGAGGEFDSSAIQGLQLDENAFREALRTDRLGVESLFTNTNSTGVTDQITDYLDEVVSLSGFLNQRSGANGSISRQILIDNERIDRIELRVDAKEIRLRKQFSRLEQLSSAFQSQGAQISNLSSISRFF